MKALAPLIILLAAGMPPAQAQLTSLFSTCAITLSGAITYSGSVNCIALASGEPGPGTINGSGETVQGFAIQPMEGLTTKTASWNLTAAIPFTGTLANAHFTLPSTSNGSGGGVGLVQTGTTTIYIAEGGQGTASLQVTGIGANQIDTQNPQDANKFARPISGVLTATLVDPAGKSPPVTLTVRITMPGTLPLPPRSVPPHAVPHHP